MDRRDVLKALAGTAVVSGAAAQESPIVHRTFGGEGDAVFLPAEQVPTYHNRHGVEHPVIERWHFGLGQQGAGDRLTFERFIQKDVYGYTVLWTGWKESEHTIDLVGQWVAIRKDPYVYGGGGPYPEGYFVSTGGKAGQYIRGMAMDPTWADSTRSINLLSSYEDKARVYLQTFEELMAMIEPKNPAIRIVE